MRNRKGNAVLGGLVGVASLLIIALVVFGGSWWIMSAGGSDALSAGLNRGDTGEYDFTGKNVKHTVESSHKYNASDLNPTLYVYDEQPSSWGEGRVSLQSGYISTATSSAGSATITETPGVYYVRAQVSGYYDEFFTIEIPSSGDTELSQYNDAGGAIDKVQLVDVETLSTSNLDMGITTNETTDKTYHVFANFNVDDNEGFLVDEIKFQEDATYSFATDSDGDGIYDEGINKIVFKFEGAEYTLFDAATSVNEFSGDDEHTIDVADKLFDENSVVSMKFEVTCDATLDTTGDADEKCGNGEDFLDDVILVDGAGNTATFHLVG